MICCSLLCIIYQCNPPVLYILYTSCLPLRLFLYSQTHSSEYTILYYTILYNSGREENDNRTIAILKNHHQRIKRRGKNHPPLPPTKTTNTKATTRTPTATGPASAPTPSPTKNPAADNATNGRAENAKAGGRSRAPSPHPTTPKPTTMALIGTPNGHAAN